MIGTSGLITFLDSTGGFPSEYAIMIAVGNVKKLRKIILLTARPKRGKNLFSMGFTWSVRDSNHDTVADFCDFSGLLLRKCMKLYIDGKPTFRGLC